MKNRVRNMTLAAVLAGLCLVAAASAQSAPTAPAGDVEAARVQTTPDGASGDREDHPVTDAGDKADVFKGLLQTLGALAIVVALIFLARLLLRRAGGQTRPSGGGGPVEILTRKPAGPKQQLMLVRLGERLILVGAGPGGFAALSEVTDPREVERLMQSAAEDRRGTFAGLLRRGSPHLASPPERRAKTGQETPVRDVTDRIKRTLTEESQRE